MAATVFERLRYPEQPMLAALVLSVTRDGGDPGELARQIAFHIPDEKDKRHGQAVAAASLPKVG